MISPERIRIANGAPLRTPARYVLYWSQMNRRVRSNHALVHAVELANELDLPVLFYEGLTCTYQYASDRLHTFLLEGVPGTAEELSKLGVGYVFYLRRKRSDPNDVLYRLAEQAACVVTDDYPTFIAAGHNRTVAPKIAVQYRLVDSSCIVPMSCFEKREYAAYTIRPKIRRLLPKYLEACPRIKPKVPYRLPVPPEHTEIHRDNVAALVAACDIDHSVPPVAGDHGGSAEAQRRLKHFLRNNLARYARERNQPSSHATSNLSAYLHFGCISSLDVALQVQEYAARHRLIADEFLEELIVRRELAFNFTRFTPDHAQLSALPDWALRNLKKHARDPRPVVYSDEQLETGATYDDLWNATQKELLLRGRIHGYYRMYWGKKLIEWTRSYEKALELMIRYHDRYSLDGRDPNTYTNILWCFGLHDRPWQSRPVFGQIRYMSYEGMKRKTRVSDYIEEIEALSRGQIE